MASIINTNVAANSIHNIYNKNTTRMNAAMTRVATTQKINSPKDGASKWAISEKMRDLIRANDQANQNVQNDTALLKTAQDGLGNTLDILTTLKERAIDAANDSNVNTDRVKISEEVKQLVAQIDDNAVKVKFNGRQLLNGAQDAGSVTSTANATNVSPNVVTATSPQGNAAIYGITGLRTKETGALSTATTLLSLVDSKGNTIFNEGDKITINWMDNGTEKSATVGALTSTTDLGDLNTAFSDATGAWVSAGATFTGASDMQGSSIAASVAGYYFVGAANHNISNVSIAVTNAAGETNTAAQAALEPTAIQQSYGNTNYGTNMVFNIGVGASTDTNAVTGTRYLLANASVSLDNDDDTKFFNFGTVATNTATTYDNENTEYTLTVNGEAFTFTGDMTINQINEKLKNEGVNVRLHYTKTAGEALYYDGEKVTTGTYGGAKDYEAVTGLNIIAGAGEEITSLKITADSNNSNSKFKTANKFDTAQGTDSNLKGKLALDNTTAVATTTTTDTSSNMLPQGEALQFYVGGEANFGINFSIGKATVENLFGTTGDKFAEKFTTKEGAEEALALIDDAINKTLVEQTRLGAMEARLGYTSDNLTSMNTNLTSADSAIRDADMAKEMVDYMRYSVLSQTSQAMLAQASQNAYSVLNLLQQ